MKQFKKAHLAITTGDMGVYIQVKDDIIIKADTNICYEECRFIMAIVDAAIPRVSDQTEECNHDDER